MPLFVSLVKLFPHWLHYHDLYLDMNSLFLILAMTSQERNISSSFLVYWSLISLRDLIPGWTNLILFPKKHIPVVKWLVFMCFPFVVFCDLLYSKSISVMITGFKLSCLVSNLPAVTVHSWNSKIWDFESRFPMHLSSHSKGWEVHFLPFPLQSILKMNYALLYGKIFLMVFSLKSMAHPNSGICEFWVGTFFTNAIFSSFSCTSSVSPPFFFF